jgi:hypothetical protein
VSCTRGTVDVTFLASAVVSRELRSVYVVLKRFARASESSGEEGAEDKDIQSHTDSKFVLVVVERVQLREVTTMLQELSANYVPHIVHRYIHLEACKEGRQTSPHHEFLQIHIVYTGR